MFLCFFNLSFYKLFCILFIVDLVLIVIFLSLLKNENLLMETLNHRLYEGNNNHNNLINKILHQYLLPIISRKTEWEFHIFLSVLVFRILIDSAS